MKILLMFADMVRGDISSLKNLNYEDTKLETILKSLGGRYYTNAYTPSPDTARAWGNVISGCYGVKNGSIQPGYYPRDFYLLQNDLFTFLSLKGYVIYALITPREHERGFFPSSVEDKIKIYFEPNDILEDFNQDSSENKILFYYSEDYHKTIMDEATIESERKARELIGNNLEDIINKINIDEFDKFLLFSDHGCRLDIDDTRLTYSANDNKTNVVLYLKDNKEQKELYIDNKLVSLLDIFPTVASWFDEKIQDVDGISLNEERENRKIYIEDGFANYQGFLVEKDVLERAYFCAVKHQNAIESYSLRDLLSLTKESEVFTHTVYAKKFLLDLMVLEKEERIREDKMDITLMNSYDKNITIYSKNGTKLSYLHGERLSLESKNNHLDYRDIFRRVSNINRVKITKAIRLLLSDA